MLAECTHPNARICRSASQAQIHAQANDFVCLSITCGPHGRALAQELAQLDYECLRFKPSKLAAAAMLVAHAHVGDRRRLAALSATSGYSTSALKVSGRPGPLSLTTSDSMSLSLLRLVFDHRPEVEVCDAGSVAAFEAFVLISARRLLHTMGCLPVMHEVSERGSIVSSTSLPPCRRSAQTRCCRCTRARRPLVTAARHSHR